MRIRSAGKINIVLHYFNNSDSLVKLKLLRCYSSDFQRYIGYRKTTLSLSNIHWPVWPISEVDYFSKGHCQTFGVVSHAAFTFCLLCFQFDSYLSDIGGSLGLYFGMSLLSLVQIIELVVDLFIYSLSRSCFTCKQRVKVGHTLQETVMLSTDVKQQHMQYMQLWQCCYEGSTGKKWEQGRGHARAWGWLKPS